MRVRYGLLPSYDNVERNPPPTEMAFDSAEKDSPCACSGSTVLHCEGANACALISITLAHVCAHLLFYEGAN